MLPAILAVGAIAAVVLLLIGIFGRSPESGTSLPRSTTSSPLPTTPATTTPTTPPPTTTLPPTVPATEIPETTVVVLNSTDTALLASRVTDYLAGLGWQVAAPDNFFPLLEVTTVYYPEGQEAAARLLAATVPGETDTVAPAIPEVAQDVLTVVLGNDAEEWAAPGQSPPPTTTTPT